MAISSGHTNEIQVIPIGLTHLQLISSITRFLIRQICNQSCHMVPNITCLHLLGHTLSNDYFKCCSMLLSSIHDKNSEEGVRPKKLFRSFRLEGMGCSAIPFSSQNQWQYLQAKLHTHSINLYEQQRQIWHR